MTYGELLTYCWKATGLQTKTDFARELGMKDADHLLGAMNDRFGKKPSLDLLERACKLAGFEFEDCIDEPKAQKKPISRKHAQLHRKLQELLDYTEDKGETADYFETGIETFHTRIFRRR